MISRELLLFYFLVRYEYSPHAYGCKHGTLKETVCRREMESLSLGNGVLMFGALDEEMVDVIGDSVADATLAGLRVELQLVESRFSSLKVCFQESAENAAVLRLLPISPESLCECLDIGILSFKIRFSVSVLSFHSVSQSNYLTTSDKTRRCLSIDRLKISCL